MKKPSKAKIARKLYLKAEKLWKEFCHLRDGEGCMVQKRFPEIPVSHSQIYQIDHFISRQNKKLFFDVRNGTRVCSSCNQAKHYDNKAIDLAINQIVLEREGSQAVEEMVNTRGPNLDWKRIYWLEEVAVGLETKMVDLIAANGIVGAKA